MRGTSSPSPKKGAESTRPFHGEGSSEGAQRRDEPAEAVTEEHLRHALRARVDEATQLACVVEKLVEAHAEAARPLRATVAAKVDGHRADAVLRERAHDVRVPRAVVGVAWDDGEDRLRAARRHGRGVIERRASASCG